MKKTGNRGQGLVEYLILVCLISVSAIAVVSIVGKNMKIQYAKIADAIAGKSNSTSMSKANAESYRSRGMNDFMESAQKQDE